jgi:hypothetical protein
VQIRSIALILILISSIGISSNASASCYTNQYGHVVCGNGEEAGGYNSRTGRARKSEKNQYGVATTTTSKGGKAKSKNGKGVYQSPNGKNCYTTANSYGCN